MTTTNLSSMSSAFTLKSPPLSISYAHSLSFSIFLTPSLLPLFHIFTYIHTCMQAQCACTSHRKKEKKKEKRKEKCISSQ